MKSFSVEIRVTVLATALLAAVPTLAQEGVQIYGRIGEFATQFKTGNTSRTELVDHGSRLGFTGRENLGGGLVATFGLEMGYSADSGAMTNPQFRHSYVALGQRNWGTVALGRLDSGTVVGSPIYSPAARIVELVGYDAGSTAISTSILNARNRTSNAIGYASPKWGGFTARARYYLRGAGTEAEKEDAARSLDLGVDYAAGNLYTSLSYGKDDRKGGLVANEMEDKWQFGARYRIGAFTPYTLLGRERFRNQATTRHDVDYWLAGVTWSTGPHKAIVNVMERDVQTSLTGERRRWQVAYIYAFSKRTEFQAFVDRDGVDSSRTNVRVRVVGAGLRHVF